MSTKTEEIEVAEVKIDDLIPDVTMGGAFGQMGDDQWDKFLASIRESNGAQEPIWVLRDDGVLSVWDGYSRVRAHRQLGFTTIKAKFLPPDAKLWTEEERMAWAGRENLYRRHLSNSERAKMYRMLRSKPKRKRSASAAAKEAGFSSTRSAQRWKRISEKLPEEAKAAMERKKINIRQAERIAAIKDKDERVKEFEEILDGKQESKRREKRRKSLWELVKSSTDELVKLAKSVNAIDHHSDALEGVLHKMLAASDEDKTSMTLALANCRTAARLLDAIIKVGAPIVLK